MSFNLKNYSDKLLFVPLGGTNEIGINVNLYHLDGKWIMVDCGSGFAGDHLPGVDLVVADISFIEQYKKDLLGIIITHAHEDHLGAVQYLWNSLECPIYTTEFTKNFLSLKLDEYSFSKKIQINSIKTGSQFNLGPFSVEFMQLTHSAPEMQCLMIRTRAGNVLHTGDWKFDKDPVVGKASDEEKLKAFGDEGILALVCDSTNVFNEGTSGSEGDVRKSLIDIIAGCPEMVVVTTFASNLARLDTLIHAGQKCGRKIVLTGRSLHRIVEAAQQSGYLQDTLPLLDERSIGKYKRSELLVIATGCQGEPMAATAKMAGGTHNFIKLAPKDTVIFSSKIIPGNEKKIFNLFNRFVKKGVEVITEKDHFVHVSGHPSVEELKRMYKLIRPKICVPVHGEPVHIHEQAKLARSQGIKLTIELENGSLAILDPEEPRILQKVENGYLAVDGNYLLPENSTVFKMRRRMRDDGIVVATVIIDNKGRLAADPILLVPGVLDEKEDYELINLLKSEMAETVARLRKTSKARLLEDEIESAIKSAIKRTLKAEINKSPTIIVNAKEIVDSVK